ncbi:MAG: hypothetical protein ACRERE_39320 [Candidatus Entotheonellia bacterium]
MANPRDSAVEEIEPADSLPFPEFGAPLSAETKSTLVSAGSGMGFLHTLREVMRVRMAKFAAVVLFVTFIAAVFAPWLTPYDPTKSKPWDSLQAPSTGRPWWASPGRPWRDRSRRCRRPPGPGPRQARPRPGRPRAVRTRPWSPVLACCLPRSHLRLAVFRRRYQSYQQNRSRAVSGR